MKRRKNRNRKLAIKIYHDSIKKSGGETEEKILKNNTT